jgi:hypothetical protein
MLEAFRHRNPDEEILERFHADCRAVLLGNPDINPDRQLDGGTLVDEWGVTWLRPESGHYIPIRNPFSNLNDPDLAAGLLCQEAFQSTFPVPSRSACPQKTADRRGILPQIPLCFLRTEALGHLTKIHNAEGGTSGQSSAFTEDLDAPVLPKDDSTNSSPTSALASNSRSSK